MWVEHGSGTDAFAGALKVRATLLDAMRGRSRRLAWTCTVYHLDVRDEMPDFYGDRIQSEPFDHGLIQTFMDPSLVAGAGVYSFVSQTSRYGLTSRQCSCCTRERVTS